MRRNRSVPILRTHGEVTVTLDGQVLSLEPMSGLMVNLAEEWTESSHLTETTVQIVDPLDERPDASTQVRLALLDLVSRGIVEVEL